MPGIEAPVPLPETSDLPEGSAVALAVRPEKLRLSERPPDGIAIAATVASTNYQGGVSIVHLTSAWGQVLKAQMASAEASAYERGASLWASWDPADAVVITR